MAVTSPKTKTKGKSGAAHNYSNPELRERLKKEILASDKGGRPGQWSARKAQRLALEYKKQGGTYTDKDFSATQRHLKKWSSSEG